ncbi:MAG: hypothetical protein KDC95_22870, partial [Planctomycetes bacterium]|nr:hypothetical protein [Planctomycetota bacterium]
ATTDGFRDLPERWSTNRRTSIGDGGWHRWQGTKWPPRETEPSPQVTAPQDIQADEDDVVAPRFLGADRKLLPAFWSADSGMHCLDHVVRGVWEHAYGHHITRLMVLANVATLLAVDARELCDWFWVAYEDAFDWVVEPNVLGMGTYALGDLFTSKPYVSGAAYIHRMGDACKTCRFDPAQDCPITSFYWAFLDANRAKLTNNPRVALMLAHLDKRSPATRNQDRAVRDEWWNEPIS